MNDKEKWAAVKAELAQTTISYPKWKQQGFTPGHWANALAIGDTIDDTPPAPVPAGFPNAPGVFAQKAGAAGTDTSYGKAIRAATTSMILSGGDYGVPVWFAKDTDPLVAATNTNFPGYGVIQSVSFRCPASAVPAAGSDHHIVVVQPDGSWVEMYRAARQTNGSWLAGALGHAQPGQDSWPRDCCRESDFTLPAGIVSLDEIKSLSIPHALVGIFPDAWGRDQVGKRMVLTGAVPTNLTSLERAVAAALQTYGLLVADHTSGSDMSFQCQTGVPGYPSLNGLLPLLPNLRMVA